jgi:PST family polysaccharide transporter
MPGNEIHTRTESAAPGGVLETARKEIPSRRLLENIAALSAVQFLNYAAPLLTIPYLVRVLGPSQFGLLAFAQGVVLYFSVITDYGFDFSATRAIAANRHRSDTVRQITWSVLLAKLSLMAACAITLALLVALVPKLNQTPYIFAASFLYVVGTAVFPIWLFQGLEELRLAAVATGLARLFTIPAIFLFVHVPSDCTKAAVIQSSVELVAALIALPMIWSYKEVRWRRPTLADISGAFKMGWPLFVGGSALYLATSSTIVILGFSVSKVELGYYSGADKLIKAAVSLLGPANQALYPRIAAMRAKSESSALGMIRQSLVICGLVSMFVSAMLFWLARPICLLILGPSFLPSVRVLQYLAPIPFLFGLLNVLGTQTMLVFEMDEAMSRIFLVGGLLGIPLTALFSLRFGSSGAATASVVIAASMVLAMLVCLHLRGLLIWRATRRPA